ncbi:hypothetical protein [Sulfurimonas sp.]|jgi:uncharacterized membrane protein|uniref:hypothetical protein n=1 Tax=Sulfurimonas sp. TaxID=2022749 RepID=UPI0025EE78FF|nr:hypothetical protein [Sulfurimonas sp.]MCK9473102.1 hypothetical protein [Sulfurimonas sp.]MDD3505761.1 hypothetical protein [Sulfurimonas sp.]
MQKEKFDKIISFLLGASWAIVIFGALITFKLFSAFGYSLAFFITVAFIVVSFFLILALDAFSINREKLYEAKKQTELLKQIYAKHTK